MIDLLQASPRWIQQAISLLNDDPIMHYYDYLNAYKLCLWSVSTFPVMLLLGCSILCSLILALKTDVPSEAVATLISTAHWVAWMPFVATAAASISLVAYGYFKTRKVNITLIQK